ncbi:Uncharacterized membrane protein [Amycolatopsis marina]|uniref:Uncharacterized membrane protein n=1 Tax=Amycolatopsis marina TaxID=490629 RepID=A0A1I0X3J5_9PSEU|nr:anthrone oxygenase family protein [Amycolatopsis marina]SFA94970.1 Uncharacterized membrane protein [Amycolatopsis marina]
MNEFLRTATLVAATISAGLLAGLFYAFSIAVMPGLRRSADRSFVDAMSRINVAIVNPWFLLSFVGAPLLTVLTGVLHLDKGAALAWIVAAFVLALATLAVTGWVNIPLNNALGSAGPPARISDPAAVRSAFETRWVRWNHLRTLTSTGAFVCLACALVTV